MANLYLDKAGLQILLTKLTEKYEGKFLGLHAQADIAAKVANKLTINIDGKAEEFDGSGAKSVSVAAAVHTHVAKDIADFATEVKKTVFGSAVDGTMEIHTHSNFNELQLIAAGDVSKWNAKVGVNDANRLAYTSDNMSGVANVKDALDVLAKNVVLAVGAMSDASANMKSLETAIANEKSRAEGIEGGLQTRIKALEDANAEGGDVAKAIGAAQKAADDAQAAADAAQGEVDALEGVVAQFKTDQATKDGQQDSAIEAAQAQADKGVADAAAEAQRAAGEEAKIRQELADEAAEIRGEMATEAARVDKKIADDIKAEADRAKEVEEDFEERISAAEAFVAAQPAKDEAQDGRLDALEALFKGDESVDAKIAAAEKAAKDYADQKDTTDKQAQALVDQEQDRRLDVIEAAIGEDGALESRVAANEAAIDVINGTGEGSIKKAVADLVDGAPAALDTLNELAAALRDNADVLDAVEEAFDGKLATLQADVDQNEADCDAAIKAEQEARAALKTELQKEIDDDVKVVADALANEKDATKDGSLAKKIADEIARADAEEKDIRADFAAADQGLAARIAVFEDGEDSVAAFKADYESRMGAVEGFVDAQPDVDKAQNDRIKALEDKFTGDASVEAKIAAAKQEAIEAAAAKDTALHTTISAEIDADVEAEAKSRDDADKALDAKIAAINDGTNGILAKAKKYADDQDAILKKELQDEIDTDVKVVADELSKQQDAAQAGTLAAKIKANADDIAAIKDGAAIDSFADVEAKFAEIGIPMQESDINSVINAVFNVQQ